MRKLLVSIILVAPVSVPSPEPPHDVGSGEYKLLWNETFYRMTLEENHNYTCHSPNSDSVWYGTWEYDRSSRILMIKETTGSIWNVRLGKNLNGDGSYNHKFESVYVSLRRIRK
jgi:hypothetical protein